MRLEQRKLPSTGLELREKPGTAGKLTGYAVIFNTLSEDLGFREKVAPTAFDDTLSSDQEVKLLWSHDTSKPLASRKAGTLKLWKDDKGLRFEADLADTSWGRDAAALIKRGDVDAMSFGFTVPAGGDQWQAKVRTLLKVTLREISPVAWPAYQATAGTLAMRNFVKADETLEAATRAGKIQNIKENDEKMTLDQMKNQLLEAQKRDGLPSIKINNMSDFLHNVRFFPEQLRALGTFEGAKGGFLVPNFFADELQRIRLEGIVRPRARVFDAESQAPDAQLDVPALDQGKGLTGGVKVVWNAEGQPVMETSADFENISYKPDELTAFIKIKDKLLNNSSASRYLTELLFQAITAEEDKQFLIGDGVKAPLGVANSPCRIELQRQVAGTYSYVDILKMMGALTPGSYERAVFVATADEGLENLLSITDAGGNTVLKFGPQRGQAMINGIPVIFSEHLPAVADRASLMLCDFRSYGVKDGYGPEVKASAEQETDFVKNISTVKAIFGVAGAPLLKNQVALDNGKKVSPFVVLA